MWDAPIVLAEDSVLADVTADWLGAGGSTFAQNASIPRLLCAATAEVCAQAADLLAVETDPGPLRATFDSDGLVVHRLTPITGVVTGGDARPGQVTLDSPCIDGSPATVPVAADGTFQGRIAGDVGPIEPCRITAAVDGVVIGEAQVAVQVAALSLDRAGRFNRPGGAFGGFLFDAETDDRIGGEVVAALSFAPCIDFGGTVAEDGTFIGSFSGPFRGWCSVATAVTFADGGAQEFGGPAIPNTYVCTGQMVNSYDRETMRVGLVAIDGATVNRPYDNVDAWQVEGEDVTVEQFGAALSHGDCVDLFNTPQGTTLRAVNVDTGCPDGFWQTGITLYRAAEASGFYTEDAGGIRMASQTWQFQEGDTFVVDDAQTILSAFGTQLGRHECVRLDLDGATQHFTHRLVNRDWRGD